MSEDVRRETDPDRFEISVDGTVAGLARFVDVDGRRVFFHTEVGEEFGGRGLAATLVARALDETRDEGLRIVAVCPYVARYVERHPEQQDIRDPVTSAALDAARTAMSR